MNEIFSAIINFIKKIRKESYTKRYDYSRMAANRKIKEVIMTENFNLVRMINKFKKHE